FVDAFAAAFTDSWAEAFAAGADAFVDVWAFVDACDDTFVDAFAAAFTDSCAEAFAAGADAFVDAAAEAFVATRVYVLVDSLGDACVAATWAEAFVDAWAEAFVAACVEAFVDSWADAAPAVKHRKRPAATPRRKTCAHARSRPPCMQANARRT